MEDFKVIFYILLAVGYFVFSYLRKYFKEDPSELKKFRDENEPPVHRPQVRPVAPVTSFEDILRELQPKMEQAKAQTREVNYEQNTQRVYNTEIPKVSIYEHEAPVAISLEETMIRQPRVERQASFKPYAKRTVTKLPKFDPSILRNPATVRDAFILSEIFNRKYN